MAVSRYRITSPAAGQLAPVALMEAPGAPEAGFRTRVGAGGVWARAAKGRRADTSRQEMRRPGVNDALSRSGTGVLSVDWFEHYMFELSRNGLEIPVILPITKAW
jgi:hypothetical protein